MTSRSDDEPYQTEVERQWSEASSIRGVDPEMLDEQIRAPAPGDDDTGFASFSPWLIPYAAISTSPLIAAFLAVFADGDPPRPREIVALLATGFSAWVVNVGFASMTPQGLSTTAESAIRFGVLTASGVALWGLYLFWMGGDRRLNRSGLLRTVVVLLVLSGLFWVGRQSTWWAWMGR